MSQDLKQKILNKRWILVLVFVFIYAIVTYLSYRGKYLEVYELGQNYIDVFNVNFRYRVITQGIIFGIIFFSIIITNKFIKKGLKVFFTEEKIEMPKLPNKSIAFIIASLVSIFTAESISQSAMLFLNAAWFGVTDKIFNLDIGFFMFQKPFIETIINAMLFLVIGLAIYTSAYYIITFNICFKAVDRETLKKNTFIKQLVGFVRIAAILVAVKLFVSTYGIANVEFLRLDNYTLYGAGLTEITIKLWGYRILAFLIVGVIFVAIRFFNKGESSKVITTLAIVPIYLVFLFILMTGMQLIYVNNNELDKQRDYINSNIEATKKAYNIDIDEVNIENTGVITAEQALNNEDVINNILISSSDITLSTLSALQTSTGYYSFNKTIPTCYKILNNQSLVYVSPREILSKDRTFSNKTYEYTHGYGVVVSSATSTDENGNIKFIQKEFDGSDSEISIKKPRIYFGIQTDYDIVTNSNNKKEIDYPLSSSQNAENTYDGKAGLKLGFLDKLAVAINEGNIGLALSSNTTDESKILINRSIIDRAKVLMPNLIYDNEPYLVITDSGELVWVIDAYTVSREYPYSNPMVIEYNNGKGEINYIRNSVKILVDAYDGTINYYITDKTDPIIVAYSNIYDNLFKNDTEIPEDIAKHFVYPKYLYKIQSKMLEIYHNISTDVLYRGDDIWKTSSNISSSSSQIEPYYTFVKTIDSDESTIGLTLPYTPNDKKSINAYLVGKTNNSENILKLYKFSSDSNVLGIAQLSSQIEEDERISKEIQNITVTGTRLIKDIVVVPLDGTLLYIEPIYQISLNEKNSVPILKKVIVASGNKIAIGNSVKEAMDQLLSERALKVEVEDTDTVEGLIESIIKANNNLTESNKTTNWEQIGKDLAKLQELINFLDKLNSSKTRQNDNKIVEENNIVNTNENNVVLDNLILQD